MSDIRSKPFSKTAALTKDGRADAGNFLFDPDKAPAWHHLSVEYTISYLRVDSRIGLDTDDARVRAELHGPNLLSENPPRSPWLALAGVIALQMVSLNWSVAQAMFETTALGLDDWLIAFAVASSILFLEEGRKLATRIMAHRRRTETKRANP